MTRPERLKTSLTSLGTKLSVSVCRSASVAPLTPTYHLWSPAGDKPWYLHRGKTAAALHLKPFTWGNQRRARSHHEAFGGDGCRGGGVCCRGGGVAWRGGGVVWRGGGV